jgi:hypothetical protein
MVSWFTVVYVSVVYACKILLTQPGSLPVYGNYIKCMLIGRSVAG